MTILTSQNFYIIKEIFHIEVAKFIAKLNGKNFRHISFVYLVKFLTYIIILLAFRLKIYNFLEIIALELTHLLHFSTSKFGTTT